MRYFFLTALLFASFLNATPVDNPAMPKALQTGLFLCPANSFSVRMGYEGNFIRDRRMKQTQEGSGEADNYQLFVNSGKVTLNLLNRLDIFTVLGRGRAEIDWRVQDFFDHVNVQTTYHFAWALGAKAIFYEWCNVSLAGGGRFFQYNSPLKWMTSDGVSFDVDDARLKHYEWQLDLGMSYKIDFFIPYIAVKYSLARAKIETVPTPTGGYYFVENGGGKIHFKSDKPIGMAIGCSLTTTDKFLLNLEARLFDEEAVTITGELRF